MKTFGFISSSYISSLSAILDPKDETQKKINLGFMDFLPM